MRHCLLDWSDEDALGEGVGFYIQKSVLFVSTIEELYLRTYELFEG